MFLGIDCSTQSLKLQVINDQKVNLKEVIVNYDQELPQYNTKDGVIRFETNGFQHIGTPTLLFVEALELALEKLKSEFNLASIVAVSGSGQQHGSVWWLNGSFNLLESINENETDLSGKNLKSFLEHSFSTSISPIWMDASTTIECNEITENVGSAQSLAYITGSRAYERFTGPQIKHLYKHQPEVYENTERISLISSFLASLFIGKYAPIDYSDGSGMNILDIHSKQWNQSILDSIAPNLKEKLGEPVPSSQNIGLISSFWVKKYGFNANCEIYAFSGDNPCSLVGLNLNRPGEVAISLGTSDVLFGVTNEPKPNENEGSILIHPLDPCNYMMMLVFKNGAMTRNFIKNSNFAEDKDWSKFNEAIKKTSVGSNNKISFYFKETEITPPVFHTGIVKFNNENNMLTEEITTLDCRGLIESQALAYKLHSRLLGLEKISSVIVTGGGSVNKEILQIIADVFECNVVPSSLANTAASGAAIRALDAHFKSIKMVVQSGVSILSDEITYPIVENFSIYRNLFERYAKLENTAVNELKFLNARNIWLSIGQELGFFVESS